MILNYIKNLIVKRALRNCITNVHAINDKKHIKTIGLFLDESFISFKEKLIEEIVKNGIKINNVEVIFFKESFKKGEVFLSPTFGLKDFNFNGKVKNNEINDFINKDFDVLINYYDVEKPALLLVTNNSKAKFKVGFSSIDKRLNHFMINATAENHVIFITELFRYLKILNKI